MLRVFHNVSRRRTAQTERILSGNLNNNKVSTDAAVIIIIVACCAIGHERVQKGTLDRCVTHLHNEIIRVMNITS